MLAPVKSDVGMSKSSVVVGNNKESNGVTEEFAKKKIEQIVKTPLLQKIKEFRILVGKKGNSSEASDTFEKFMKHYEDQYNKKYPLYTSNCDGKSVRNDGSKHTVVIEHELMILLI